MIKLQHRAAVLLGAAALQCLTLFPVAAQAHHHDDHHHDYDHHHHHHHPVATVAAVTATAVIVGSMVRALPPNCSTVIVNGIRYSQCGSSWYEPRVSGSTTQYVVVNAPR